MVNREFDGTYYVCLQVRVGTVRVRRTSIGLDCHSSETPMTIRYRTVVAGKVPVMTSPYF
jgi:hypothetical protein